MPRARYIKPGFLKNEDLAECEPLARLLYTGLWMWADREGRMEDRPKRIKANILPYDDCDGESLLAQLESKGFVIRYEVDGQRYLEVANFLKHQHPHQNEPNSTIPCAKNSSAYPVQAPDTYSASTDFDPECSSANPARLLDILIDSSSCANLEHSAADATAPPADEPEPEPADAIKERIEDSKRRPSAIWVDDRHGKWYKAYWNHKSRPQSRKQFERTLHILVGEYRTATPDRPSQVLYETAAKFLIDKAVADRNRFEGTDEWDSRVRMLPATWLNNRRWEDEATPSTSKANGKAAAPYVPPANLMTTERMEAEREARRKRVENEQAAV